MFARQIRILPLQVNDCRIIDERGITRENGTDIFQLIHTVSGSGLLHDDRGGEYILDSGDVVFFPPGAAHDYYQYGDEQWVTGYITFNGLSLTDSFINIIGFSDSIFVLKKSDFDNPDEIGAMFLRVAEEFAERSYVDDLIMHTLLYKLLYILYTTLHKREGDSGKNKKNPSLLAPALEYIHNHIKEPLPVGAVAARMNMKEYSFYKAFRKLLGTTPAEYILNTRLEKAKYLLTNTDMTMREIGFETGMITQNYLNRAFRAKFGITPGEYRKKYSGKYRQNFSERDLPVYQIGVEDVMYDSEALWENERHEDSFSIMLCNRGCGILANGLKNEYFVRPGYLCLLTPDSDCVLRPSEKPWELTCVSFNGKHIKKLFNALGIMDATVIRCDGEIIIDHRYCREVRYSFSDNMDALYRRVWDKSPEAMLYKSVLLYELITFTGIAGDSRIETTDLQTRIAPVVDIINMYYNKKLPLSELADAIGVSENTLIRLFRAVFKKTPKEYITDVRINQAKRLLLRHPNRPVADIGRDVGFSSSSHFISAFRAKCSITPDDYRNIYFY